MDKLEGPDYLSLVIEWEAPPQWEEVDEADVEAFPMNVPEPTIAFEDITAPHITEHKGIFRSIALAVVGIGSLLLLALKLRRAHA